MPDSLAAHRAMLSREEAGASTQDVNRHGWPGIAAVPPSVSGLFFDFGQNGVVRCGNARVNDAHRDRCDYGCDERNETAHHCSFASA
jgi:hypothetical protein